MIGLLAVAAFFLIAVCIADWWTDRHDDNDEEK